jgi:hypothetical protein
MSLTAKALNATFFDAVGSAEGKYKIAEFGGSTSGTVCVKSLSRGRSFRPATCSGLSASVR